MNRSMPLSREFAFVGPNQTFWPGYSRRLIPTEIRPTLSAVRKSMLSTVLLVTASTAARPELGAPDWRSNVPGKPMTNGDVTDVVSWLISHRTDVPGQPYPNSQVTMGALP